MSDFGSMKARELLAVLTREPLAYEVARQRGSHRRLKAPGRPPLTFAFDDSVTIAPGLVRKILCRDVGLGEEEAPTVKDGWSVAGDSYKEVRRLAEDGVSFALASAAEDRGEAFDEAAIASLSIEHYVPAPA